MLSLAESAVADAVVALAADPESLGWRLRAFRAEQDLLLVRLAADSGARRGSWPYCA
jgi:hypothetical protein